MKKLASIQLEEKLVNITFAHPSKIVDKFNVAQFEKDARKVRETFKKEDEDLSSRSSYL